MFCPVGAGGPTLGFEIGTRQTADAEHGRIETQTCWQVEALDWLTEKDQWRDLQSVGRVEAAREVQGQTTTDMRYYLSSVPVDAGRFSQAVRRHWGIEHSYRWILDVVFREDDSRVRTGHAAEYLALIQQYLKCDCPSQPKDAVIKFRYWLQNVSISI